VANDGCRRREIVRGVGDFPWRTRRNRRGLVHCALRWRAGARLHDSQLGLDLDVHSPWARRAASGDAAQRASGGWPSNAVRTRHFGRRPPGVLVARALDRLRHEMETRQRSFVQKQDGSVILETALMITVLLILMFGMIDFGRVMYTSNSLVSA